MIDPHLNTPNPATISFSIDKNTSINKITDFLDKSLPGYLSDLSTSSLNEDDLSQELCIYLNREAIGNHMFMFHFQYKYPSNKRSSDFSVISAERFASKDPIYVIEAKRLPTPGSGRSKEYVRGNLGGVERFKRNHHGVNLKMSAMIGYIQADTFNHWHLQVNAWITELTIDKGQDIKWEITELLSTLGGIGAEIHKLKSTHSKIDNSVIELSHYWIDCSKQI